MYNKYSNKKTLIDNVNFDSIREAEHYLKLKALLKGKKIKALKLQPVYVLQTGFTDRSGTKHHPITYKADFEYIDDKGLVRVEDIKGMKTEVYRIKKKLLLYKYPEMIFAEL